MFRVLVSFLLFFFVVVVFISFVGERFCLDFLFEAITRSEADREFSFYADGF